MSDISDISCTPPEIREAANVAIQNLLPTKSRKHKVVYEKFVQWCKDKNIKNYTDYFYVYNFQYFISIFDHMFKSVQLYHYYSEDNLSTVASNKF
jgi:hypothetical protein